MSAGALGIESLHILHLRSEKLGVLRRSETNEALDFRKKKKAENARKKRFFRTKLHLQMSGGRRACLLSLLMISVRSPRREKKRLFPLLSLTSNEKGYGALFA